MMTWFIETPWPGLVLAASAAGVCFALWSQQRRAIYLVGSIFLLILLPGLYELERRIVTPREQAEAAVLGITRAFQQGDAELTGSYISQQAPQLAQLAKIGVMTIEIGDDMRISDFRIVMSGRNTRALAKFRLNATIAVRETQQREFHPTRWETTWQMEENQWRMIKIQELDSVSGQELYRVDWLLSQMASRQGY